MVWKCLLAGAVTCFGFHGQLRAESLFREKVTVRIAQVLGCEVAPGFCLYVADPLNDEGAGTSQIEFRHKQKAEFSEALFSEGQVVSVSLVSLPADPGSGDATTLYLESILSSDVGAFAEGLVWASVKVTKGKDCHSLDKVEKLYECRLPVIQLTQDDETRPRALQLSFLESRKKVDVPVEGELSRSLRQGKTYQVLLAKRPFPYGAEHYYVLSSTPVKGK